MNARKKPLLLALTLLALTAGYKNSSAAVQYAGVNLSSAEFGVVGNSFPGTYDSSYTYPTQAEVDYFKGKGMNILRLCFRWERLQRSANASFDATEFSRLDSFITQATAKGMYVIVNPHNFARYFPDTSSYNTMQSGSIGVIGSASVPNSVFADLWSRLANTYKTNNHVIFGLMNEPNAISTSQWVSAANAAIVAIRATGAPNLISVPGVEWTGAWSWSSSGNATAMLGIVDSGNNYVYEVHQYMDSDSSGTSTTIVDANIGVTRVSGFTQWLKDNNRRGFLGEFAVANSTIGGGIGDETLNNLLSHIQNNSSVWLGWTWWAAGPWWGEYMFTAEPSGGADRPVMTILTNYIPSAAGPPAAPTANAATSVTNTAFTANWSSASGATGYRLDVATTNTFSTYVTGYSNLDVSNVLLKSVTGLSASTTYYYRLRAYNGSGTSSNSSTITVTTVANPPPAPTVNAATGVTNTAFTVNWSAAAGATGYRLDVSSNNGFANFVTGYSNLDVANVLTRNVTGLSAGTGYYYRLRAYNAGGTSTNSTTNNVTTLPNPPPAPVATAATAVTYTSFAANWNTASTATGYRLDVATNNAFTNFVTGYSNLDVANVLTRSVTNLTASKAYYFRVRAYNTGGSSANSGTNTVTTLANPPASNTISGSLELQSFAGTNRLVRFVTSQVNGGATNYLQTNDWVFTNATPTYSLQVPTNTTHISAKTAWNLRRRQAVTFTAGAATVNFTTAANNLKGGDIVTASGGNITNTDNAVTSSDYLLLLGNYLQAAGTPDIGRADVDGDGAITASDYLLLLGNYLTTGDPQ